MRKTILAIFALAVGLVQPTVVSAHGGGFGGGGGYPPASFGSDYAEGGGDCHLVAHRVKTQHGWRIRRVQVCS